MTAIVRFTLIAALVLAALCPNASAHSLWLNPATHYPAVGQTVDIGVGWGHKYTATRTDEEVREDRVEKIWATDPDGKVVELIRASASVYQLKIEKAGAYLVAARIKPGMFTITPEGRKWANKKTAPNPIKCTAFDIEAQTLIVAGGDAKNLSGRTGQPLEVTALNDPGRPGKGEAFNVRVLYDGKPLAGAAVKAAYPGHADQAASEDKQQQAGHSHGGQPWPVETVTDAGGNAALAFDRPGYWMIAVSHNAPYPDAETCDENRFNNALTVEVK